MSGQSLASSVARLQEIEDGVRSVLGTKRWWITPEEFLANVEEHRRRHDRERSTAKPINQKPAEVRDYHLKRYVTWNRQMEFREVAK
jgi:hypothetical protein